MARHIQDSRDTVDSRHRARAARHRATTATARPRPTVLPLAGVALLGTLLAVVAGIGLIPTTDPDSRITNSGATHALARPLSTMPTPPPAFPRSRETTKAPVPTPAATSVDTDPVTRAVIPEVGSGTFQTATADTVSRADTTYRIETERGLPVSAAAFARFVRETLADGRSWSRGDPSALQETAVGADFRVVLASPRTTDRLCAPAQTRGRVSCRNGDDVVINAWRWVNGADAYRDDLSAYRRYLVNHEVGHRLGHPHATCPSPGAAAPVMLQQTLGLDGCTPNSWPGLVDLSAG